MTMYLTIIWTVLSLLLAVKLFVFYRAIEGHFRNFMQICRGYFARLLQPTANLVERRSHVPNRRIRSHSRSRSRAPSREVSLPPIFEFFSDDDEDNHQDRDHVSPPLSPQPPRLRRQNNVSNIESEGESSTSSDGEITRHERDSDYTPSRSPTPITPRPFNLRTRK
ncbi:uncharacterized protein LOC118433632 [Folsomia candida]|nr:uncharacterized protein LOC118433632 [Folsomia candida]